MGLTISEAIRLFIYQSISENKIPFSIQIVNPITHAAICEAEKKKRLKKTSIAKLKKEWGNAKENDLYFS